MLQAMLTEESFPLDGREPSGDPSVACVLRTGAESPLKFKLARKRREARELERQQVQLRLRLRGTGLEEGVGENAGRISLTTTLRRFPRGPPQRDHAQPPECEVHRGDATATRLSVTRHGRRSVLTPSTKDPASLPKLIDVLSAHRLRAAVPDCRDFAADAVSSLPQLQAPRHQHGLTSKVLESWARPMQTTGAACQARMRNSTSLPLL